MRLLLLERVDQFDVRVAEPSDACRRADAVVEQSSGEPAIIIPYAENEKIGKEFAVGDIWAYRNK